MTPPAPGARGAAFVLVTVLLDAISIGLILPVLPTLVESFTPGDPVAGAGLVGLLAAIYGAMQFVGGPFLGALSDSYGRRPVILGSNLGLALDYLSMVLAPNVWLLIVGRVVAGFTTATVPTAVAYVTDVTPPAHRAAAYARIAAVFSAGLVMGPAIGGLLAEVHPRLPFLLAAGLALANFVYGATVLPESLPREGRPPFAFVRANPLAALRLLSRTRRLAGLAVVSFLDGLALVAITATFVLYTSRTFGWSEGTNGLAFMAVGVALALVNGVLAAPVIAAIGERRTLHVGIVFGIVGFMMYGLAPSDALVWAAIPFLALWALADGPTLAFMSAEVTPAEQGRLQGALAALQAVAETIGPLLFTQVYALAIGPASGWAPPGAPFLLAAVLHAAALGVALAVLSPSGAGPQSG